MGLDTYAARTPHRYGLTDADIDAFTEAGVSLDRGLKEGAILGAHYAALVEHVSGVDLDQEWIPHDVVVRVAATFAPLDWADPDGDEAWDAAARLPGEPFPYEISGIRAFLRVCADRGLALARSEWTDNDGRYTTTGARSRDPHGLTDDEMAALDAAAPGLSFGGSLRGTLYLEIVQHVTGVFLQQPWIEPETVVAMADAFASCDPDEVIRNANSPWHSETEDVVLVGAFFRVCAQRGLGLYGSF